MCGDLNTPRREHPDGSVWTFARDRYGAYAQDRGERWDSAESAVIRGLEARGYRDAFRALHGFAEREPTWGWPRHRRRLAPGPPHRVRGCRGYVVPLRP